MLGKKKVKIDMVHLLLIIIYAAFISLGLPDAILGSAWPVMQPQFNVPVSWLGPVALIISAGTVVSSLLSDRLTRKFKPGIVTSFSVVTTAVALIGFALSSSYWMLCLWAVPYGLGAGCIDACLNNYVAIHYSGKHMSWLHCMWSLGATAGPYAMSVAIAFYNNWELGYWIIGFIQIILSICLFASLPVWKKNHNEETAEKTSALSLKQIFSMPGAKLLISTFFCYCAMEQTAGQWASSYFYGHLHLSEEICALFASLYYSGITAGRFINGFLTIKFSDRFLVRLGVLLIFIGLIIMVIPVGAVSAVVGMILIGLGSAPIYPCVIHATPSFFGSSNSQAVIGVEMASAYIGICVMPPVFGYISDWIGIWSLPIFLLLLSVVMFICHERAYKVIKT